MIVRNTIILLFLFLIVLTMYVSYRLIGNERKTLMNIKISKLVISIYFIIIIFGTLISYISFHDDNNDANQTVITEEEWVQTKRDVERFYQMMDTGDFSTLKTVSVNEKWEFSIGEQNTIQIIGAKDNIEDVFIFVEKENDRDHQITVTQYTTKYIVEDFDYTYLVPPPMLTLQGNNIVITAPDRLELEFMKYNNVFTISQFVNNHESTYFINRSIRGNQVLYFQVPHSVEIQAGDGVNIHFVNAL